MRLRDLDTTTMLQITARFLAEGGKESEEPSIRALIEKSDLLRPHLVPLTKVHEKVVETAAASQKSDERAKILARMMADEASEDAIHDNAVRNGHALLSLAIDSTKDKAQKDSMLELQRLLYPDGIALVNDSYLGEAGAAKQLDSRLNGPLRKRLKAIQISIDGAIFTLEDYVQVQIRSGIRLGILEGERQRFEQTHSQSQDPTRNQHAATREAWEKKVQLFLSTLEADEILSDIEKNVILAGVRKELNRTDTQKSV